MITLGLPKFSKISFVFNIFVPNPVQEMVYLKAIQKITPVDVFVSGTTDQKMYLKKLGGFSPLSPPWIRLWVSASSKIANVTWRTPKF